MKVKVVEIFWGLGKLHARPPKHHVALRKRYWAVSAEMAGRATSAQNSLFKDKNKTWRPLYSRELAAQFGAIFAHFSQLLGLLGKISRLCLGKAFLYNIAWILISSINKAGVWYLSCGRKFSRKFGMQCSVMQFLAHGETFKCIRINTNNWFLAARIVFCHFLVKFLLFDEPNSYW